MPDVRGWLLDSDPAIRWQVLHDLADEPEMAADERARVATEGWGANILAQQNPDGGWGRSTYKKLIETPDGSATFVLTLLRDMGVEARSEPVRRAVAVIRDRVTHYEGRKPFFQGETEACINGRVLAAGAYFGEPDTGLFERLLDEQLEDGGWNCEAPTSRRSSFHSTINVLEGLLEMEKALGPDERIAGARRRGEVYLLERRMLRSLSSGEMIDPAWTRLSYPPHWHYDVLRGLDYLRRAGVRPDARVAEAIDIVKSNRGEDGRWPLQNPHPDVLFDMGERDGEPSRWNTLRALRVLRWAGQA